MKLVATFAVLAIQASTYANPQVQPLRDSEIDYGCGCSFQVPRKLGPNGPVVLQWEQDGPANIRVDGKLHKLKVLALPAPKDQDRRQRVGDKEVFELFGDSVSARAECTVTRICEPEDESCEVTIYKAKLTVRTPGGTRVLDAWASCGC
ncbi:hypothetical protein [Rubrivivax gelatinosus]|uniref:hypothetical protein n=1 Tax=Rubrivivax gelatinosus TaxID=28068 RepID=UPI0012FDB280|nr:hypothetical protein [Rubrivivax gelatinosus]MBG6079143.1 hypothetical protein [Rubrivivax gelatinosus]